MHGKIKDNSGISGEDRYLSWFGVFTVVVPMNTTLHFYLVCSDLYLQMHKQPTNI